MKPSNSRLTGLEDHLPALNGMFNFKTCQGRLVAFLVDISKAVNDSVTEQFSDSIQLL